MWEQEIPQGELRRLFVGSAAEEKKPYCTVILLAGGSGKRMGADKPKQYLEIAGKPLLWYPLNILERSKVADECILVAPRGDISFVEESIVEAGKFSRVRAVVAGGRERYESVWMGLQAVEKRSEGEGISPEVIMIHDGVRPFLTEELLERCFSEAVKYGACTAAVPSKDTVTISDGEGFERETPDRKYVWNVQTPQAFRQELLFPAFRKMAEELGREDGRGRLSWVTDDVSVVRYYTGAKIRLVQGDYRNIKVTTAEDLEVAKGLV